MMDDSVVEKLNSRETLKKWINCLKAEMGDKCLNTNRLIIQHLQRALPGCKVHIFGSRLTGLATRDSDCDIYIDHDGHSYHSVLKQSDQLSNLHKWGQKLEKYDHIVTDYIPEARVPILCVIHSTIKIPYDISCKSGLSVENSILIREFLSSDFRVSWLVITMGWWMRANHLKGKDKFTSYTTTWLVLFFLMRAQPYILSSVMEMREGCEQKSIGYWDCHFNRDFRPSKLVYNPNFNTRFKLLVDFFEFYSSFNFDHVVLCPLTAHVMPRQRFEELDLPPEYESYTKATTLNPDVKLEIGSAICLQDPFDLSHNIAKGVSSEDLKTFKDFCHESYTICESHWGTPL